MRANKSVDSVWTNHVVKRFYTGSLYWLSVWFFFPFVLLYPLLFSQDIHLLVQVIFGIVVLSVVYQMPDILDHFLPRDTLIAKQDDSILRLHLESDYEIDLSAVRQIEVDSGLILINKATITIYYNNGKQDVIKTRYQLPRLVVFLQGLKSVTASA